MKKVIFITGIYTAIIFALCLLISVFFIPRPESLIAGTEKSFVFYYGLYIFLVCLPGILLSGFTVSCAVLWQKKTGNSRSRFSPAMFSRFKLVLFSSLAFILFLSLNEEIFKPSAKRKIDFIKEAPSDFADAISIAGHFLEQNQPILALQYAKKAVEISPKDTDAKRVLKLAEDSVDLLIDNEMHGKKNAPAAEKVQKPLHVKDKGHTILELLEKSDSAAQKKHWFDAHYWANLAVEACDGKNTNLDAAVEKSNYAWKMLSLPVEFDNSAERNYYKIKKDGYVAFSRGDFLKAYYTFLGLKNNYAQAADDPDVKKFLALSEEDLENQYFFFDETKYIEELSDSHKVYFSLDYPDGSKNVFYISNAMDIKKEGSLVRYMENFNVVHYDENGKFAYSFFVPFAKAVAQPVSEFGEENLALLGIEKKWEYVPFVILQSVDRNTEGLVSRPVYSYEPTGLSELDAQNLGIENPQKKEHSAKSIPLNIKKASSMVLPMQFSDFNLINAAACGAKEMPLPVLFKLLPRASGYGFSQEVFAQNLVQRGTFPFIMLIMFVFCACIGWNYRIENPDEIFKFKWTLLIPVLGFIMIVAFNIVLYFFNMLSYVLVGLLGTNAVFAAAAFYVLIFFAASVLFLSRKA
ncbi:MAG: hypothetical protein Q4P16_01120 [Spirochaetales bacterium]|nr:hypothetical protein [Spirochaetales bacterium]